METNMTNHSDKRADAVIAIDIGTTNIEAILYSTDRSVIDYRSERNEQRRFGSDVAARICAAASGHADEMRVCILSQLCGLITGFIIRHPEREISRIMIAGNTTMLHILLGYDCSGLGMYPFKTVSLAEYQTTTHGLISDFCDIQGDACDLSLRSGLSDNLGPKVLPDHPDVQDSQDHSDIPDIPDISGPPVISDFPDIPVTILPGLSAYIGADIYAGAVACGFANSNAVNMLIDLGTNAEMILGNKDQVLTASAAAGPAFESGRIFKGTEGIEMMHRLLELGVIDRTGLMKDEYFEQPAQKNIRKLQLAKAAIRAAITVLMKKYEEYGSYTIDKIFISGNFGNNINEKACIAVGMLPESFAGRIVSAGNTVLEGCVLYHLDPSARPSPEKFEEVILANEPDFNELLMGSIDL
ncbi:MAG: DUF4445 domain-containing protein [Lachnospiraceae bacterium]|nr:DUF4445 domain-containing protein [Lachnospiraceae bacterium]